MDEYCDVCECDPCDCHGSTPDKMRYAYVKYKNNYYVPRAPSFCMARERNDAFKQKLKIEPVIVGTFEWEKLSIDSDVSYLEVDNV
tara:strand:+ start:131 stop:388 length:258 start_codon:yes stop_codon:yes gene_type:complete